MLQQQVGGGGVSLNHVLTKYTFSNLNSVLELDENGVHTVRLQNASRLYASCLAIADNL